MAFLFDYHKIKEESQRFFGHWDQLQEAEYNVGRAFHQLGTRWSMLSENGSELTLLQVYHIWQYHTMRGH